jgi:DNA gyrase subunit B
MTDADVDGAHIKTLLLTFFYRYMRPLIQHGFLYVAWPPLFQVKIGRTSEYLYDERELEAFLAKNKAKKVDIQRYKGLGEMNFQQLWETTMNPDTRRLVQITLDDALLAEEVFERLMGKDVPERREFIMRNAKMVKNLDI